LKLPKLVLQLSPSFCAFDASLDDAPCDAASFSLSSSFDVQIHDEEEEEVSFCRLELA